MFYFKTKNLKERGALLNHLKEHGIQAAFHYVPLHSSPAGKKYGRFNGDDVYTTTESDRLIRLPMWYGIEEKMQSSVIEAIQKYYC